MIFSSGLGAIFVAIFDAILLSIPILIIWLLIKTLNKASRIEQVELEVKKLREEIQSLQDKLPGGSNK
jgi:di/tricarboxylate transporter